MKYRPSSRRPAPRFVAVCWLESSVQFQLGWLLWRRADFSSTPLIGDLVAAWCRF